MARICWYCINAYRENSSEVSCNVNNYQYRARTDCCNQFVACPKKKYAPEEQLNI